MEIRSRYKCVCKETLYLHLIVFHIMRTACFLSALQTVSWSCIAHPSISISIMSLGFLSNTHLIVSRLELQRQPLLLPVSFGVQHKRTASCGLLIARATRPYSCRAVSAAFLVPWSCLTGEHPTGSPTRLLCTLALSA